MAAKVPSTLAFANFPGAGLQPAIVAYLNYIGANLSNWTPLVAARLNQALPEDGSEAMTAPLTLKSYTTATRPASAATGSIIFVSDAGAGLKLQYWTGAAWESA